MVKRIPSTPSSMRVLTASDVDAILGSLDPELALESQKEVFTAFSSASPLGADGTADAPPPIQTPHRITISAPSQTTLFMPSRAASAGGTGIKIVSVPTKGGEDGLPATTMLLDEASGKVRAVINARKLTALRNACGSALSLRALPPQRAPTNLLIFGSGAQALSHAILFIRLWKTITSVTFIIRRSTPRSASLLVKLQADFPRVAFKLGVSDPTSSDSTDGQGDSEALRINLPQAVHNANIILTATSSRTPLFNSVDVTSGTHVIMVGSYTPEMHEVSTDLIQRAGKVVVDSREACAREAGELIAAGRGPGELVELGELLGESSAAEAARKQVQEEGDINIFKSVGVGIQDVAIANVVLQEAERLDLGTIIPDYD